MQHRITIPTGKEALSVEDFREFEIKDTTSRDSHTFRTFKLPSNIDSPEIYLQVSDVIADVSSTAANQFMRGTLKEIQGFNVPSCVWIKDGMMRKAITPVPIQDALLFWSRNASWGEALKGYVHKASEIIEKALGDPEEKKFTLYWQEGEIKYDGGCTVTKKGQKLLNRS